MKSQLSLRGCAAAQTQSHGNTSLTVFLTRVRANTEEWGSNGKIRE